MANVRDLATSSPQTRQGDHVAMVQAACTTTDATPRQTRDTGQRRRDDARPVEYRRFTIEEANAGLAQGWTLSAGWFRLHHAPSAWAWFRREAPHG